jgi:hypothetical protein
MEIIMYETDDMINNDKILNKKIMIDEYLFNGIMNIYFNKKYIDTFIHLYNQNISYINKLFNNYYNSIYYSFKIDNYKIINDKYYFYSNEVNDMKHLFTVDLNNIMISLLWETSIKNIKNINIFYH